MTNLKLVLFSLSHKQKKKIYKYWEANGWTEGNKSSPQNQRDHHNAEKRWQDPEGNDLKINTDCAFREEEQLAAPSALMGVGLCSLLFSMQRRMTCVMLFLNQITNLLLCISISRCHVQSDDVKC